MRAVALAVVASVAFVTAAGCTSFPHRPAAPPAPHPVSRPKPVPDKPPPAATPPATPPAPPATSEAAPAAEPAGTAAGPAAAPAEEAPAEEGLASYYADALAGHPTASGERYKPDLATCAHRTHPFGTILEVTAVASGKSATCRVNDRGPWVKTRVVDVSKTVARKLGMLGPGVLQVRVRPAQPLGTGAPAE